MHCVYNQLYGAAILVHLGGTPTFYKVSKIQQLPRILTKMSFINIYIHWFSLNFL